MLTYWIHEPVAELGCSATHADGCWRMRWDLFVQRLKGDTLQGLSRRDLV